MSIYRHGLLFNCDATALTHCRRMTHRCSRTRMPTSYVLLLGKSARWLLSISSILPTYTRNLSPTRRSIGELFFRLPSPSAPYYTECCACSTRLLLRK